MGDKVLFTLMGKDQLSKVFQGLGKTVKGFGDEAKKASDTARESFSKLLSNLKDLGSKSAAIAKGMGSAFHSALSGVAKLGKAAFGSLAIGATGLVAGLGASVKAAGSYDHAMREVWTLTDWTREKFDEMSQSVIRASVTVPDSAATMAKSLYSLVSAGRDGAESIKLLNTAAKLGVAGVSDTETALGLLVSMLNAFGMETKDAMKAADMLFATVKAGQTTLEQMAQFIPVVFPTAKTIGADPREVLSMFAALTAAMGGKLNPQAASGLASALKVLYSQKVPENHPLKDFIEQLRKMDPTKALAKIRSYIMQFPEKERLAKLREIFPDATAAGAVATLLNNFSKLRDILKDMYKEAPGSVSAAFEIMSDDLITQSKMLWTNFQALSIQIGNIFLPAIKEVAGTLAEWVGILARINMSKVWEQIWGNPEEALPQVKKVMSIIKTEFFSLTKELAGGGVMTTFLGNIIMTIANVFSKLGKIIWTPLAAEASIIMDKLAIRAKIIFHEVMASFMESIKGTPLGRAMGATGGRIEDYRQKAANLEALQKQREGGMYENWREFAKQDSHQLMKEIGEDIKKGWKEIKDEGTAIFKEIATESIGAYRDLETGEMKPTPGAEAEKAKAAAEKAGTGTDEVAQAATDTHKAVLTIGEKVYELGEFVHKQQIVFNGQILDLTQKIEKQEHKGVTLKEQTDRETASAGTPGKSWGISY